MPADSRMSSTRAAVYPRRENTSTAAARIPLTGMGFRIARKYTRCIHSDARDARRVELLEKAWIHDGAARQVALSGRPLSRGRHGDRPGRSAPLGAVSAAPREACAGVDLHRVVSAQHVRIELSRG